MGLWDRLVGRRPTGPLEWVEPPAHEVLAVRHTGLRLKAGAALLVRAGQACVVSSGSVADVIGPGRHQLGASILPGLAGAKVVRDAGGSFRANVSFVSVAPHPGVPWATVASVVARDAHNVALPAKASGEFGFVVTDPAAFVREVVAPGDTLGGTPGATRADVAALVASQFGEIFRTGGLDGADLFGPPGRLGLMAGEQLSANLRAMGISLLRFIVKTVTTSHDLRRPHVSFADAGVDGYRADVPAPLFPDTPPAAPTESGLPALPAGLADILEPPLPRHAGPKSVRLPLVSDAPEGVFAARQPNTGPKSDRLLLDGHSGSETEHTSPENLFDLSPGSSRHRTADLRSVERPTPDATPAPPPDQTPRPLARPADRPPGPPPLPATLAYYVSINGMGVGPFDLLVLAARVRDGSLGRTSLVWRPGMDGWHHAESVSELAPLFPEPPPIPRSEPAAGEKSE